MLHGTPASDLPLNCKMNLSSLQKKPVFYIILMGFVIMVWVTLALLNSAIKGKEKDFNDKLFYVVAFYEDQLNRDTAFTAQCNNDTAAVTIFRTRIKNEIDSLFSKNEIPLNYVFAIGKFRAEAANDPHIPVLQRRWLGNNLIWSSDTANNSGLISTKLKVANNRQHDGYLYYLKIFFPFKSRYIFNELLPLIIVLALTLLILFVCFMALIAIIKKQNLLAETKNDFINNMTHELKTPLFTISIASKMLAEQGPVKQNDKYASYISSIQQETQRLNQLVETLLQTAAIKTKQGQDNRQEIDLHQLIRNAVQNIDLIREEQKATIELDLQAKAHHILADQTQIEGVLYSLADNAFKYTEGPAHITIRTENRGNQIMISFRDNGIGMDVETKGMIFERFFRAHTGNLHDVKGYGIGLSYVKTVIDAHGGTITVNTAPGKGSEFILLIPCVPYGS